MSYSLFELEDGNPTSAYELSQAINDEFLVEPRSITVPVLFPTRGVTYDDLSDQDKNEWDMIEWTEDGSIPARVEPSAVHSWFFNADTVDKVLETLMDKGQKVAGSKVFLLASSTIASGTRIHCLKLSLNPKRHLT